MIALSVIISGIFFGAVASAIARRKGRSDILWFLLGFCLHLFGLVVLFLPSVCKVGITKKCPECAEIVRAEANRCRYCGNEFLAANAAEVS